MSSSLTPCARACTIFSGLTLNAHLVELERPLDDLLQRSGSWPQLSDCSSMPFPSGSRVVEGHRRSVVDGPLRLRFRRA